MPPPNASSHERRGIQHQGPEHQDIFQDAYQSALDKLNKQIQGSSNTASSPADGAKPQRDGAGEGDEGV